MDLVYNAVLFDGPFHGQVWRRCERHLQQEIRLLQGPKVTYAAEAFHVAHTEHIYRLARTFPDLEAALYEYKGER